MANGKSTTKANKSNTNGDNKLPLEARCLQCIQGFLAPKTTQDAVDVLAAEYATANLLRIHAEKRYESVKKQIVNAHEVDVAKVRNDAAERMEKMTRIVNGEDWSLTISANKPATSVNADKLRTELVKRGVNIELIDEAIKVVTTKNMPALSIVATRMPD